MVSSEKFRIQWNDFESHISEAFRDLRENKNFVDVTLAFDDGQLQAHKVILAACSPFFSRVLDRVIHEHPLLYLKGIKKADLVSVLDFMYFGEVNVAEAELTSFLSVAGDLQVKGLTQLNNSSACKSNHSSLRPNYQQDTLTNPSPPTLKKCSPSQPYLSKHHQTAPSLPKTLADQFYSQEEQDNRLDRLFNIKQEEPESPTPFETRHHSDIVMAPNERGIVEGNARRGFCTRTTSPSDGNEEMEALVQSYLERSVDELTGRLHWLCRQCGKSHQNYGNLRDHIEANHIEGPRLVCQLCLKSFKSSASLRMHKRRFHKGEY